MKNRQFIFLFTIAASLLLSSCGGGGESSSEGGDISSEPSVSSESSQSSDDLYEPEDTPVFDRDDGTALAYTPRSEHTLGTATNSESYDYDDIIVQTPKGTLNDDFMYCYDVSSAYSVETHGGIYYGKDGKEADFFALIKDAGATHVRLRLWNDPYDGNGNSYGGGENDLATAIHLGKRATAAGLKVFLDFHYSDSWADPSKQYVPKAWASVPGKYLYQPIGDYTGHVLNAMKEAGVDIDAVQIGNETNNGMAGLNGTSKWIAYGIEAGVQTAKSVFPDVTTFVHLTNITNYSSVTKFLNNLASYDCDSYDAVGFSYYPYWHGGRENLLNTLNDVVSTYGKKVAVVETSWGFTDEAAPYSSNQYSTESCASAGGYETSYQGQASEMADIVNVLSQVEGGNGIGVSYWEPGWLSVQGSGWISKYGAYYNDYGKDWTSVSDADLSGYTDSYCRSSWANQAYFSYTGKALPSLYVYKHIQDGDKTISEDEIETVGIVEDSFSGTYDLKLKSYNIPSTAQTVNSLGQYKTVEIEWDEDEYADLATSAAGKYTIHGTCGGYDVTCAVTVLYNYVDDYSFENQTTLQGSNANEYAVGDPWELEASADGVRVESKGEGNRTGSKYFHWWSSGAFTFDISQTLTGVAAGTYSLQTYVLTHMKNEYGGYNSIYLYYQIGDGDLTKVSMLDKCAGYSSGLTLWSIDGIVVENDDSTVKIGMSCDAGSGGTWGHNDDWSFALQ